VNWFSKFDDQLAPPPSSALNRADPPGIAKEEMAEREWQPRRILIMGERKTMK